MGRFDTQSTPIEGGGRFDALSTPLDPSDLERVQQEQAAVEPEESPGFLERVTTDLDRRSQMGQEIVRMTEAGEQTVPEALLQITGKVFAGSALDIIGEGIVSGVEGLSAITPDEIEDPVVEAFVGAGTEFLETTAGQLGIAAAEAGAEAYAEFKADNPRAARNLESIVDIGALALPLRVRPRVKAKSTFADKASTRLTDAATAQSARQKASFVDELITPKKTKKVREAEVLRTTETPILRRRKVELSPQERIISDEVSKLPEVSSSKTTIQNLQAINAANRAEADALIAQLSKNDVLIPKREFMAELGRAQARLAENPLLVGDAAKISERITAKMRQIVEKNPGTASGLLKSRKELDKFIASQRSGIFDPAQESALSTAVREIRQTTNNFIDDRVANVAVKDSLKKQSNLFRAMDNITPKAADEANNAVMRLIQKTGRVVNVGSLTRDLALTAGGVSLGVVGANVAPFLLGATAGVVGTGAAGLGAARLVMSPVAKKSLAALLKATDRAIRITTDEALIAGLREDRASVKELLNVVETEGE